jgi:hypothetical protein
MANVMTIAEIKAHFDSEWVLVEDPETNDAFEVQSGTVAAHSKDRDEVYRLAATSRPKRFAILYTGQCPRDAAIIL